MGIQHLKEIDAYKILFDTWRNFSTAYNAITLGIDLSRIDKIVFSHGQADHTGGLLDILKIVKDGVEVIAYPDIWAAKYVKQPEEEDYAGVPFSKEAAETLDAFFNLTKEPVWISQNIVTSREITMIIEYEEIDRVVYVKEKGELKPDPLWDDQALFL